MTKTHYKTFLLLQNHDDKDLIKDDENVTDVLKIPNRKRKFKFVKQYEMWNLYKGNKMKKLRIENKAELQVCLDILIKSNILGRWETGKTKIYIMNPMLVFVSPNKKYDTQWEKVINTLFDIGDCSNEGGQIEPRYFLIEKNSGF